MVTFSVLENFVSAIIAINHYNLWTTLRTSQHLFGRPLLYYLLDF